MHIKTLSILLLFFILLDLTKINDLWGENIHRRMLHHTQRGQFNPNKTAWINFINNYLSENDINYINQIKTEKKSCINKISPILSNLFGGTYSKKCTLYYKDFNLETQRELDKIGKSMIPKLEKLAGKKLYLGESDFRCVLLRYEGKNSNFVMHYDTEPKNCYRTIFLIKKEGSPPPFIYYDKNGNKIEKYFNEGEGLFFQGTKTFHGVSKSDDPNMKRYMIGWQYSTDDSIKDINLCSKLRGATILDIIKIFLPYVLITLTISLLLWYILNDPISKPQIKLLLLITVITTILFTILPKVIKNIPIGTGLSLIPKRIPIIIIFSWMCFGNIYYTLIFINYLFLTEMFLPRSIVGYHLKLIDII